MTQLTHFSRLENMYQAAPINQIYKPTMTVGEGIATIRAEVDSSLHHSAGSLHGSVYFKMLDDAAFFAANSLEDEVFVLTSSFTTYLLKPVVAGELIARAKVVSRSGRQFVVDATVSLANGDEVGRGNGVFVKGKFPLIEAAGYGTDL